VSEQAAPFWACTSHFLSAPQYVPKAQAAVSLAQDAAAAMRSAQTPHPAPPENLQYVLLHCASVPQAAPSALVPLVG
jgi:hypothetical protein